MSELKVHIELTRFVQPEKIEIDANERAVNEKSPYCFFVCTTFDSFLNDLSVTVRAPRGASQKYIERILEEKESWICKHIEQIKMKKAKYESLSVEKLTNEELTELADKALEVIPGRVEHFAKIIGVTYGRITIRNQKTRWGSCSSKGNLNFNCLLMLTPSEIIDYVVVHELCHRKEMNHSKAFWLEVEKVLPDYRAAVKWLKEEGSMIILRQK